MTVDVELGVETVPCPLVTTPPVGPAKVFGAAAMPQVVPIRMARALLPEPVYLFLRVLRDIRLSPPGPVRNERRFGSRPGCLHYPGCRFRTASRRRRARTPCRGRSTGSNHPSRRRRIPDRHWCEDRR